MFIRWDILGTGRAFVCCRLAAQERWSLCISLQLIGSDGHPAAHQLILSPENAYPVLVWLLWSRWQGPPDRGEVRAWFETHIHTYRCTDTLTDRYVKREKERGGKREEKRERHALAPIDLSTLPFFNGAKTCECLQPCANVSPIESAVMAAVIGSSW